jgi:hypothetical protein
MGKHALAFLGKCTVLAHTPHPTLKGRLTPVFPQTFKNHKTGSLPSILSLKAW